MKWLILLLAVAANASASIFIKIALPQNNSIDDSQFITKIIFNYNLWIGVVLYVFALALYAVSLTMLPINIAHPTITSGAIVLVLLSSIIFFNEPIKFTSLIGITLVILGITLITSR